MTTPFYYRQRVRYSRVTMLLLYANTHTKTRGVTERKLEGSEARIH